MNKKIIFLMITLLLLTLSCSLFNSSSPAPAALSTSGVSAELAATMTVLAETAPEVGLAPAPQATQPGIAATQPSFDATQPSFDATQPSFDATQPSFDSEVPPLDTTFSLEGEPIPDERVYEAKLALAGLGYEVCLNEYLDTTPFYTAQAAYAVSQFQAANGLTVSGSLDPATWAVLFGSNPQPAPQDRLVEYPAQESLSLSSYGATDMAVINGTVWAFPESFGFIEAFNPSASEIYQGIYSLSMLPGEEYYQPFALTTDGTLLWVAFQGDDAILQAYDVAAASSVEGILRPVLPQSIHFDATYIYGLAFDGKRLWASVEDPTGVSLVSINPAKEEVEVYPLQMENFPAAVAYDPNSVLIWVPVSGVFGDQAILSVNPRNGEAGEILGACGSQVVFDGTLLWVVKIDRLVGVDPASGEARAVVDLGGPTPIRTITFDGERLWLLNGDTGVILIVELR